MTLTVTTDPTEKQAAFLFKLYAEKHNISDTCHVMDSLNAAGQWTKRGVSNDIDRLMHGERPIAYPLNESFPPAPGSYLAPQPRAASPREPMPDVPAGFYAVTSYTGNNDLDFYRVDRPGTGKWAGYTFVRRVIGGRGDTPVRGAEARRALQMILDTGPQVAGLLYGREIGRCCKCNRHLTDEFSRAVGMGPDCRGRHLTLDDVETMTEFD